MDKYPKTKVYYDGSHYIGIPHVNQPWKKRKTRPKTTEKEQLKQKFEKLYKEHENKNISEKKEIIAKELINDLKSEEKALEFAEKQFERKLLMQIKLSQESIMLMLEAYVLNFVKLQNNTILKIKINLISLIL